MKVLMCEEARPLLEEYHDEQLAVGDHIAVGSHLAWCDECSAVFAELRAMRGLVRASVAQWSQPFDREAQAAFQTAVVARARAETALSWPARAHELIDDRHVVYACIGALAATVFCVAVLTSMMRFAANEQPGSLAAVFRLLSTPKVTVEDVNAPGTDRNPVFVDAGMAMPRGVDQIFVSSVASAESVFTLSAVVTREGRVKNVELHSPSGHEPKAGSREAQTVDALLSVASVARFEPARVAGLPVAVNMVWLVANTTVRATKRSLDLPVVVPARPKAAAEESQPAPPVERSIA